MNKNLMQKRLVFTLLLLSVSTGLHAINEKKVVCDVTTENSSYTLEDVKNRLRFLFSEFIKLIFKFLIPFTSNDFYLIGISIVMSLLNIIYIRTIYIFRKELKNCNSEELDSLRSGWTPRHIRFVFV